MHRWFLLVLSLLCLGMTGCGGPVSIGGSSAMETDGGEMKANGENSVPCSGDTIEDGSENSAAEDHKDETSAGGEKSLFGKIKRLFNSKL